MPAALTTKEVVAGRERYTTVFSEAQAAAATEATVKAIYSRVFLWLVDAINREIKAPR